MKKRMIYFFFILISIPSISQDLTWDELFSGKKINAKETKKETVPSNSGSKEKLVTYEIIDGDTIPVIYLPDLVIMDPEYKKKYDNHLYYIKRMLPYARLITQITEEYDSTLVEMDKRKERKKYIEHNKELAMAQFEDAVKKMSVKEGKYLVKLIHRECGETAYDVIAKYIGGPKTFFWQTASRLGGADLKLKYDPKGADKMMEEIMQKIDKGEIKVKKLKIDPKAIEKKEAAEAEAKKKKKEMKKKK